MTDTRRQAAEEWALAETEGQEQYNIAVAAHLAGQELGEQRAVEGIVRWLRDEAGKIVDIDEHVTYHLLADAIERGEWKEGA